MSEAKNIIQHVAFWLASMLFFYGVFSFGAMALDAHDWEAGVRILFCILTLALTIGVVAHYFDSK